MFSVSVMREKRKMNDELEIYFEKETLNKSNSAVHFHLELALTKKRTISSSTTSSQKTYNYIFELALTQEKLPKINE